MNCGSDCGKNWRHLISGEPQDPGSNSNANLGHPEKRAVRFNPLQKTTFKNKNLFTDGPGQTIRIFAGVNFAGYGEGFQIDDDDIVVRGAGYEGALSIGLH